jgi:hypothetical protein
LLAAHSSLRNVGIQHPALRNLAGFFLAAPRPVQAADLVQAAVAMQRDRSFKLGEVRSQKTPDLSSRLLYRIGSRSWQSLRASEVLA